MRAPLKTWETLEDHLKRPPKDVKRTEPYRGARSASSLLKASENPPHRPYSLRDVSHIRRSISSKDHPKAFAAFGTRLVAVMPGAVLTSST